MPRHKFNYLTKEESEMPLNMALRQIVLGLQSCKTKGDALELLEDAVGLGIKKEQKCKCGKDEDGHCLFNKKVRSTRRVNKK